MSARHVSTRHLFAILAILSVLVLTTMPVMGIAPSEERPKVDADATKITACDDFANQECAEFVDPDAEQTFQPNLIGIGELAPVPSVIFLAGYSRFDDSDPLEHDARVDLHEQITDAPGVYINKLQSLTEMPRSTVRYHLKILEREGLVHSEKILGNVRYYPSQSPTDELAIALEKDATATVLEAIAASEPLTVSALAEAIDRTPSTVHYHLDRLADEGLIDRERDGESVMVSLQADARLALSGEAPRATPAD